MGGQLPGVACFHSPGLLSLAFGNEGAETMGEGATTGPEWDSRET